MNPKVVKIFEKMQALDRRWIYIVVLLAISIPLIVPFDARTYVTEPVIDLYTLIDSYAGREDRAILMNFFHDASTMPELTPMQVAILRHAFERDIKVFTLCFMPQAAPIVEYTIDIAREGYDVQSGVHYLNFGFKPISLFIPIVLGMGEDISEAIDVDADGRKIENLPIMEHINSYNQMNLVIDFSGSASVMTWIVYARARFGVNVGAGVTAVLAPDYFPYLQTGQIVGMLGGLKGAAEYEELVDLFASQDRDFSMEILQEEWVAISDIEPMHHKTARLGMNAQSVAHIMIIVFIVLGNIGYFVTGKKKIV